MAFGTTPKSNQTLNGTSTDFPVSGVYAPDTPSSNVTALGGARGAYQDSNAQQLTAALMTMMQPAIVQKANAVTGSAGKTLTCAFANNNIKGNSIVVVVGMGEVEGANITLAITDTNSNAYTQAGKASQSTTLEAAIFYATNVGNGANTVTVTIAGTSSTNTAIAVEIYELFGLITYTPDALDQTVTGSNSGSTSPTATTLLPLVPNELAFVAISAAGGTITAGSNWTLDSGSLAPTGGNLVSFGCESRVLGLIAPYATNATLSASNAWAVVAASFKGALLPNVAAIMANINQLLLQGYGFFATSDYYTPSAVNNAYSIFNPATSGKLVVVLSLKLIDTASGQPIRARLTTTDPAFANTLSSANNNAGNMLVGGGNSMLASITYATSSTSPPAVGSSSVAYDVSTNATTAVIDAFTNGLPLFLMPGHGLALYTPNTAAGNFGFASKHLEL